MIRSTYLVGVVAASLYWSAANSAPILLLPELSGAPTTVETRYREGLEALIREDLTTADRAFAAAAGLSPGFAPAMLGQAEIAFKRGQLDAAERHLQRAAQAAPRDAYVQASLGRFYAVGRDYAKAEAALISAVALDANLVGARMDLADLYTTVLNKPESAIPLYRATIQQTPDHAGAHYALGIALVGRDDAEATRLLTRAGELDTSNPLPAIALARFALQHNQAEQALSWSAKALSIDSSSVPAALVRNDALVALDRPEALPELTRLAEQHAENGEVQFRLANELLRAGQVEPAFGRYQRVVELAPQNATAWNNLAALAMDLRRPPAEAVEWSRRATSLDPREPQFRDTLGWALRNNGDQRAALGELVAARDLDGNDSGIWYHLGVVYAELKQDREAIDALTRALRLDPDFFAAADAQQRLQALR